MIYELRQETRYTYAAAIPYSSHVARLLPVDRPGQTVRRATLSITPEPAERGETTDFFGNRICHFALDRPHDALVVRLDAEVEVTPTDPYLAALTPPAEEVRVLAASSDDLGPASPAHGLFASPSVPLDAAITGYAALSFPARRPVLVGAIDLMKRIKADFDYVPGATDAYTSPSDAFVAREGVCQDFAQVMIAGLRGLALPARYVSGYLRTEPPPGRARLEGADATHAWVEVWCGDEAGWVGLDPTNGIAAGEDHLILAIGRDYSDVSPLDGVIVTSGAHSLTVAVDVVPLSGASGKRQLKAVE
ncbi:MAG: t [Proteobacteria bacterium]|nr:t [Pseudomonadota bacterium]